MFRRASISLVASVLLACSGGSIDEPATTPADDDAGANAETGAEAAPANACAGKADGEYCGGELSLDATRVYTCKGGLADEGTVCKDGCLVQAGDDVCASNTAEPCFDDPDGVYCGGEIGGDPKTLYTCKGNRTEKSEPCKDGCFANSDPKGPDACASDAVDPCFNDGDGAYCGDAIGGPAGKVYHCKDKRTDSIDECGAPGCISEPSGIPDICNGMVSCGNVQWWTVALTYGPYKSSSGWWDTDLAVSKDTPVVLRHASKLDKTGVYGWGYMPEFTDQVTGKRFRMLHLRPSKQNATQVGKIYPAGFVVGVSGGDTTDTGYPTYSTGAHLCIQTIEDWRTVFPLSKDACK